MTATREATAWGPDALGPKSSRTEVKACADVACRPSDTTERAAAHLPGLSQVPLDTQPRSVHARSRSPAHPAAHRRAARTSLRTSTRPGPDGGLAKAPIPPDLGTDLRTLDGARGLTAAFTAGAIGSTS